MNYSVDSLKVASELAAARAKEEALAAAAEEKAAALEAAATEAKAKLKGSISNLSPILQQNDQTLEGSFSAVWTATIATKYSFKICRVFRDLQDLQSFAPLESAYGKTWKNPLRNPEGN